MSAAVVTNPCGAWTRFVDLPDGGLVIECPRCGFAGRPFSAAEVADWFRGAKPARCERPAPKAVRA